MKNWCHWLLRINGNKKTAETAVFIFMQPGADVAVVATTIAKPLFAVARLAFYFQRVPRRQPIVAFLPSVP